MKYLDWYKNNWEENLSGRYITLEDISPLLESYKNEFEISTAGVSELGKEIPLVKIGEGPKVILAWSQMHGNESTTTKAIFDFLKFISQKTLFQDKIADFLKNHSLYILPILNPDGASLYTRENATGKDLNRDAEELSQKESRVLRELFSALEPSLCLNMHDQRSIYGFKDGKPASISFLSPAADEDRTVTESRKIGMHHIAKMNRFLQSIIPGEVGRYDDTFNPACVGDYCQMKDVPIILFEAGHYRQDYQREKSREFIFYALLSLFDLIGNPTEEIDYQEYFQIPENLKNYRDVILRNVNLAKEEPSMSVAIQFLETLKAGKVIYIPEVEDVGELEGLYGHREIDLKNQSVLVNSSENFKIGTQISQISDENEENIMII